MKAYVSYAYSLHPLPGTTATYARWTYDASAVHALRPNGKCARNQWPWTLHAYHFHIGDIGTTGHAPRRNAPWARTSIRNRCARQLGLLHQMQSLSTWPCPYLLTHRLLPVVRYQPQARREVPFPRASLLPADMCAITTLVEPVDREFHDTLCSHPQRHACCAPHAQVQMGAPGAPMMVPSGAMSAGQARPMAGGADALSPGTQLSHRWSRRMRPVLCRSSFQRVHVPTSTWRPSAAWWHSSDSGYETDHIRAARRWDGYDSWQGS